MMIEPQPVPGTDYTAHPISARVMQQIVQTSDELEQMALLASHSIQAADGSKVWPDANAAMDASWPLLNSCAEVALSVNGMVGGVEAERGN